MVISDTIFEAFLECPTKCWLQHNEKPGDDNVYTNFVKKQRNDYRYFGLSQLILKMNPNKCVQSPLIQVPIKKINWLLAYDFVTAKDNWLSRPDAVERVINRKDNRDSLLPIRFICKSKVSKEHKMLLAFDALVLSEIFKINVSHAKLVYSSKYYSLKINISSLIFKARKLTAEITKIIASNDPPNLILNRHCAGCEYKTICRQTAIQKGDLSLLSGMTVKERSKFHNKGIFTVTQLSYTFRPRRRPKRLRNRPEKYHHSLKALAIRENKIHIVGTPELLLEGTPVYVDVEGLPDQNFYYLVGLRVTNENESHQHSLWANSKQDEKQIWFSFLNLVAEVENPVIIHYGSFEKTFLKQMDKRYGGLDAATNNQVINKTLNLLTAIYGKIYFPVFSNGLKDILNYLGFFWEDTECSGLQSIGWRHFWEQKPDSSIKEKLLAYNTRDCEALEFLKDFIIKIVNANKGNCKNEIDEMNIIRADSDKYLKNSKWKEFKSPFSSLEYINSAAHWDYQRDRVYARFFPKNERQKKRKRKPKSSYHIEKVINWEPSRICPVCERSYYLKGMEKEKTFHDLLFSYRCLKLRFVKYVFQTYICRRCGQHFGIPDRFKRACKYGWNLRSYFFYQIIGLCIPQRTVAQSFNRLFGFEMRRSTLHNLKIKTADYYKSTKQQIFQLIVQGNLVQIDETRANIKGKSAFVWVLANHRESYYFLAESREGEIAQKLLASFKGVLVSDFYAAYDSIDCPQQKCLIHLIRDMNDEILNYPFDEQLKSIVISFGNLLKPIIETIDRYGFKKYFLNKHLRRVDDFFDTLEKSDYQSEAAIKCKDRLSKNREKLFTFLKYDGVPWNNNNAENSIKAFAGLRDVIAGTSTEKGTDEYLTLLTISQTCKFSGVDFLDFLRSGEIDILRFRENTKKRTRL
jgi:predicted RecB family nuclease